MNEAKILAVIIGTILGTVIGYLLSRGKWEDKHGRIYKGFNASMLSLFGLRARHAYQYLEEPVRGKISMNLFHPHLTTE